MPDSEDEARARILLVAGGRAILSAHIDAATRCDLQLIDNILRLQLTAARLGWSVQLTHVEAELRQLVDLVGVASLVGLAAVADTRAPAPGRQNG